ncbi:MAG: ATP-binding cassette domain-containing protein [Candidatus Thermoplasmatota archaeon]|nr:ATP-binding cassette domain-containing protein [Candidatus Thermoplasmatota archaeon]MBU1941775.1 ATP-binding cassette domain-containing protein [Candidatus Thermoplasmatota archaeon]
MDIITTHELTKKFNGFTAVDTISINIKKGEIFGFLGPNGAGKTTTIKMLTTLLYPTKGSATIAQYDILKQRDKVRQNIGVVFQEPALDTELTGRENLDFHARMYGLGREQRKQRVDDVLTLVDLEEKQDVLVKNYSGLMKRRLEIARGLMHYPTVLFLDEPTLGLDAQTRRAIWAYIKKMNKEESTTIFLTTHYMDEADHLCDRVGIIDRGKILVIDSTKNLKNSVGHDVITLSCDDLSTLHDRLLQESWIQNVKKHDNSLTLGVEKGDEKIPIIIEIAQSLKLKIKSIDVRKPTLDDVFLHYTGRMMRDEEPENPMKQHARMYNRR